jgi:hypothetical protein
VLGCTDKKIAARLQVSERTMRFHIAAAVVALSSLGGDWVAPIAANLAFVCAILAVSWLVFRRQEL